MEDLLEFKFEIQQVKKLLNQLQKVIIKGILIRAIGAFLVYDCSKKSSFKNLEDWIKDTIDKANSNVSVMILGNKNDLDDKEVSIEEGKKYAIERNKSFISTSAKTGENIEKVFEIMVNNIIEKIDNNTIDPYGELGIKVGNIVKENNNEQKEKDLNLTFVEVEKNRNCSC